MADGRVVIDTELDSKGAESGLSKLTGTLGKVGGAAVNGVKAAVGAATATIGAATVAVGGLVSASVNAYAAYEQLVGGVDTLFKESSKKVQDYANNAYKTAGLSANQYMETVTGFSASLLQGLGGDTVAAAEYADKAIIAMSDNANKMGTDIEMIKNAYQGFAKQNFTMLDNLKLGYGGTKEEMQRLLEDAEKISGVEYDISNFADVTEAINVMQESMGIAGTTALEAEKTISGSAASMKAAWENLLVGISGGGDDFDKLIEDFKNSALTFAGNILPVIKTAILTAGSLITTLLPDVIGIVEELIGQLIQNLPSMVELANQIITDLLTSLSDMMYYQGGNISDLMLILFDFLGSFMTNAVSFGMEFIGYMLDGMLQNAPLIIDGITNTISTLLNIITAYLPDILQKGIELIVQLALGIAAAIPELIPKIIDVILSIVMTLIENLPMLVKAGIELIIALAIGLVEAIPQIIEMLPEIIVAIVEALIEAAPMILEAAWELIKVLGEGLLEAMKSTVKVVAKLVMMLVEKFLEIREKFAEVGKNIIDGIWEGIKAGWDWLTGKISDLASGLLDAAKNVLGINSPSKEFAWIGEMSANGIGVGWDKVDPIGDIRASIGASLGNIRTNVSAMTSSQMTNESLSNGSTSTPIVLKIGEAEIARAIVNPFLGEMKRQNYNVSVIGG